MWVPVHLEEVTQPVTLSFNVSFSCDTQQGPDRLTQLCWFPEHLIKVSKLRIWAVSERQVLS